MRISKGRGWLAAVALALGTAQGDYVEFTTGFDGTFAAQIDKAIFSFESYPNRQFDWTASNVVVKNVTLFRFDDREQIGFGKRGSGSLFSAPTRTLPSPAASTTWHGSGGVGGNGSGNGDGDGSVDGDLGPRDPQAGGADDANTMELLVVSDANGGYVKFINADFSMLAGGHTGKPHYFEAAWDDGRSYSRLFTFVSSANTNEYFLALRGGQYGSSEPPFPESGTPAGVKDSQAPNNTGGVPSGNTDGSLAGGPTPSAEKSPGGSGLPQGAIIGIAVGCGVAGLLLIFGLAWYLLRRRQQKKAMLPVNSSYTSGNRGDELMAEKEASADVDITPHSPYSDEGASGAAGPSGGTYQDGAAHGEPVAAGAAGGAFDARQHLQDPPRSFTPYSDRPSAGAGGGAGTPSVRAPSVAQTDEARVSVPSPIPGRATPRVLTTPYAHLVEEGMTEEEIRRLEDEERQLDAAIEQAGRR